MTTISGKQPSYGKERAEIQFAKMFDQRLAKLLLNLSNLKVDRKVRAMGPATANFQEAFSFKIACDDRCAVVRRLATIVKKWDRHERFRFVNRASDHLPDSRLLAELDASPWSLVMSDEHSNRWEGPDAIPIILKNLPFGRLAAVMYILPGTAWITQRLYLLISRNRRRFNQHRHAA